MTKVFALLVGGILAVILANNASSTKPVVEAKQSATTEKSNVFWPEGTRPSRECVQEAMKSSDLTPKCKEEVDRWGAQFLKNTENPAYIDHIIETTMPAAPDDVPLPSMPCNPCTGWAASVTRQ